MISLIFLRLDMNNNFNIITIILLFISSAASLLNYLVIKKIISKKDGIIYYELTTNFNDSIKSENNEINLSEDRNSKIIKISDNIGFNQVDGIFNNIKYDKGKIILNDINKSEEEINKNFDFSHDQLANFNCILYI